MGEIAEDLGVSRQAVCDNLNRTEALLRNMEEKVGYVAKDRMLRNALRDVMVAAETLLDHPDKSVAEMAERILRSVQAVEE